MYLVNENTNYEKLKNEVIRALKEANILFDKITNKQVFIKMILSGTLQKENRKYLLCIIIPVNY